MEFFMFFLGVIGIFLLVMDIVVFLFFFIDLNFDVFNFDIFFFVFVEKGFGLVIVIFFLLI